MTLRRDRRCLANTASDSAQDSRLSGIMRLILKDVANEKGANWVQLSPFGDFPNSAGMQRVRKEDADAIANDFNDPLNLEARTVGLPFYVGHPDFPSMQAKYTDHAAKGRIKSLEVRHDPGCAVCNAQDPDQPCHEHGLFANVKWNSQGKQLIEDEAFHGHSVNWRVKKENGFFRPTSLKSVGFTNDPQIPVAPITTANERHDPMNQDKPTTLLGWIAKLLGKPDIAEQDAVNEMDDFYNSKLKPAMDAMSNCYGAMKNEAESALQAIKDMFKAPEGTPLVLALANEVKRALTSEKDLKAQVATVTGERDTLANEKKTALEDKTKAETNFANERRERAKLIVSTALAQGRVTAAEQDQFVNEAVADPAATQTKLSARTTTFTNRGGVGNLGRRSESIVNEADRREKVQTLVNEVREKHPKMGYDAAFNKVKKDNPELFAAMKQPANNGN